MKAATKPDGTRVTRRYVLAPEKTPRWHALERELQWLRVACVRRWDQGN